MPCPPGRPVWGEWAAGLFLPQFSLDPRAPPSGGLLVYDWGPLKHSSRSAGQVGLRHLLLPTCHRQLATPQEREWGDLHPQA